MSIAKLVALIKAVAGSGGGGAGGGFLKVGMDMETMTLDKTWKEIHDALVAGYYVNCPGVGVNGATQLRLVGANVIGAEEEEASYMIIGYRDGSTSRIVYVANSENGYPAVAQ